MAPSVSPPMGSRLPGVQWAPQSLVVQARTGPVPPLVFCHGMVPAMVTSTPCPSAAIQGP